MRATERERLTMKIPNPLSALTAVVLATLMTGVPNVATAGMISTREAVGELTRTETIAKIRDYISRSEVREEMAKHRVDPNEVSMKLASMNNTELRQISDQITQARAGGEVIVIGLTTVLLVILILLLVGRI
jgi:hypothetical protein